MSFYRTQLEDWLKRLPVKADTVLDIGGGQGNVKDRVASWDVKEYKILDLPDFDIQTKDVRDYARTGDIIFCLEVFEYLIEPLQALKNIRMMLSPWGKAYITFAFAYPHHEELELDALRYTESGIRRMADAADLLVSDIHYRIDSTGFLQNFYSLDGMHPSKNYNHHNVTGFIVEMKR